jgi:hypothetical protein
LIELHRNPASQAEPQHIELAMISKGQLCLGSKVSGSAEAARAIYVRKPQKRTQIA